MKIPNETIKTVPLTTSVSEIKRKPKGRKFFWFIFLLTLAGLVYSQYQLYRLKNPLYQQKIAQEQAQATIDKVAKLMIVPKETPQVVILQEVEKIKVAQPFFKDAENGDLVLVYSTTAIIYSPTKNKIVNVGPVIRDSQGGSQDQTAAKIYPKSTTTKSIVPKVNEKIIEPNQN